MEDVPKIVRQRLKAGTPIADHPDADVLTAFAERSLSDRERTVVLEHLSRCAECREVVALALPVSEPVATAAPSPRRWLAWPALRWGFAAAGLVVVVSLGVLQYRRQGPQQLAAYRATEAKNETPPAVPAAEPTRQQDKAQTPSAPLAEGAHAKQIEAIAGRAQAEEKTASGPLVGGARTGDTFTHGPSTRNQLQSNANLQQAQVAARIVTPPAPAPPTMAGNAPAPLASRNDVQREAQSALALSRPGNLDATQAQSSEQSSAYNYADAKVEKTKPLETTVSNTAPAAEGQPFAPGTGRSIVALTTLNPSWRITSTGGLQRSLDQGNSWQDINIPGYGTVVGQKLKMAAKPSVAMAKKDAADTGNPVTFRAVAANGADVWAGAASALLYHSTDAGDHWSRVIPSADNTSLSGDILTLNFPDSLHGTVSTSASQIWTTSDGGQTWHQQ